MRPVVAAAAAGPEDLAAAVSHGARWVALASDLPVDGRAMALRHRVHLLHVRPASAADRVAPAPVAVLWSPGGREVARQAPVLAGAGELRIFTVDGWPCGILAGDDARSPELARILQLRGARCLWCVPPSPPAAANEWFQLAGVWQLVQQTQCFALEAVGPPGRCAVHAPCELTPGETGFLARAGEGAGPALAALDPQALQALRRTYDLCRHLNPAFYRRHLARLYGEGGR